MIVAVLGKISARSLRSKFASSCFSENIFYAEGVRESLPRVGAAAPTLGIS
jgi:hypothetical protein